MRSEVVSYVPCPQVPAVSAVVAGLLGVDRLDQIHHQLTAPLPVATRERDQATTWHTRFYRDFPAFEPLYQRFAVGVARQVLAGPCYLQRTPNLRVHLPGNRAVGEFHRDADYGHPDGEVNFWVPLTPVVDTNTVWLEVAGQLRPLRPPPGHAAVFDAVNIRHGNKLNASGQTRVSLDFRCLPVGRFRDNGQRSVNTRLRFVPGGYYLAEPVIPHPGRVPVEGALWTTT